MASSDELTDMPMIQSFSFSAELFAAYCVPGTVPYLLVIHKCVRNKCQGHSSKERTSNADDTTLMAESEEDLKRLLIKVEEESGKAGLKLSIQKMKIMASSPITS